MAVEKITLHLYENLGFCNCRYCSSVSQVLTKDQIAKLRSLDSLVSPPRPTLLYHYTNVPIRTKKLLPHLPYVTGPQYHIPAVWLTIAQSEPLVANARFAVEVAMSTQIFYVDDFLRKIEPANAFGLMMSALLAKSNPWKWWVAYEPIDILDIEELR